MVSVLWNQYSIAKNGEVAFIRWPSWFLCEQTSYTAWLRVLSPCRRPAGCWPIKIRTKTREFSTSALWDRRHFQYGANADHVHLPFLYVSSRLRFFIILYHRVFVRLLPFGPLTVRNSIIAVRRLLFFPTSNHTAGAGWDHWSSSGVVRSGLFMYIPWPYGYLCK